MTMAVENMKHLAVAGIAFLVLAGPALAADIVNGDAEPRTVTVMSAGRVSTRTLDPGEHADICQNGCIVSFPDGGQMALSGMESVRITNGSGHLD